MKTLKTLAAAMFLGLAATAVLSPMVGTAKASFSMAPAAAEFNCGWHCTHLVFGRHCAGNCNKVGIHANHVCNLDPNHTW
jgi:hypothetical protein